MPPVPPAPVQVSPAIRYPIHMPPFQLVFCAARLAQAAPLNGPKMDCSPLSSIPLNDRWLPPRVVSREPVPVPFAVLCVVVGVARATVAAMLSSFMPFCAAVPVVSAVAPDTRSFLTWSGVSDGRCCSSSATARGGDGRRL